MAETQQFVGFVICTTVDPFSMDAVARREEISQSSFNPKVWDLLTFVMALQRVARCLRSSHHMSSCHLSAVVLVFGTSVFLCSI